MFNKMDFIERCAVAVNSSDHMICRVETHRQLEVMDPIARESLFEDFKSRGGRWILELDNYKNRTGQNVFDFLVDQMFSKAGVNEVFAIVAFSNKIEVWGFSPFDADLYRQIPQQITIAVTNYHSKQHVLRSPTDTVAILVIINVYQIMAKVPVKMHIKFIMSGQGDFLNTTVTSYLNGEPKAPPRNDMMIMAPRTPERANKRR